MTAAVDVRVPGLLARFTGGQRTVSVEAATVAGAVEALAEAHPGLAPHLWDGDGSLRPHLALFRNGRAVTEAAAGEAALDPGDEVVVLQAVSGG
ncbi:MAG: MoaD/ThiS family protein [Gemmatimonadetes bacterium]|nr:MoaD/ThiS family protein [Gemmatimonadota bacterium]NIS29183.1 MoaD/ThiS family protein [Actinomycetota bacterium]NIU64584.1 MoaD/ThiS family protein [Actinomycetota bacterium]NIW26370.1 hypothetical protein [Actinomycetota bacterium]NIX18938.1 hypothetical protein [Actinomycetota bacterium]